MQTSGNDQDGLTAIEPSPDPYRHIRFLSGTDSASPAHSRPRTPRRPSAVVGCHAPRVESEVLGLEARRFVAWVLERAGVDPNCYREAPLARRLRACLRLLHARCLPEARERLQREPQRITQAVSTLLIGVTEFFREPDVFSYLDQVVLPKLSASGAGLRVWSAGCADGAELYSVAILLAQRGLLQGSTLLGTDCRADAVGQAERGWYEATRLQSMDEGLRRTYFVPRQRGWQACDALRRAASWQQGDAMAGPPAGQTLWDLILCRNVAIYLEPVAAAGLWAMLAGSLRLDGVLVAGKAERPQHSLPVVRSAPCVFEKRG